MSGKAQGQVIERRQGGATCYGFRFTLAGRRYYIALGTERQGHDAGAAERVSAGNFPVRGGSLSGVTRRNLTAAERALIVLGGGFVAGDTAGRGGSS